MVKSFKNRVGRNLLTHPLQKERLLRQAESRKTVSRSFGYENRRICFRTTRLLAQLKQQLHSQTPRAEGVVKATEKGFGFLEVDAQKAISFLRRR